jgi:hypothetical protein
MSLMQWLGFTLVFKYIGGWFDIAQNTVYLDKLGIWLTT